MLMIACLVLRNNKRTTCNWKWIALMLKADTNGILWCFTDISKSRGEAPAQPQLNFPKTVQGARNRSFKGEAYAVHPWLEYFISEDSTFYYACRHFSFPGHVESTFTSGSCFKNWKKATYTDGGMLHTVDLSITRMPC